MLFPLQRERALRTEDAEAARASEGRWPRICERAHGWTLLEARRHHVL